MDIILGIIALIFINLIIGVIWNLIKAGARAGYDKVTEPTDALRKVERDARREASYADLDPQDAARYQDIQRFGVCFVRFAFLVAMSDGVVDVVEVRSIFNFFAGADPRYVSRLQSSLRKDIKNPESIDWQHNMKTAQEVFSRGHLPDYDTILFDGLLTIAAADGEFAPRELDAIVSIMTSLGWAEERIKSFLNYRFDFTMADDREETKANALKVLGVSESASVDEIKRAYRSLVKQYHPDVVAHLGKRFQASAEERFKEIQQAYEVAIA
jgi:DnaJ-domain-containing protein 1